MSSVILFHRFFFAFCRLGQCSLKSFFFTIWKVKSIQLFTQCYQFTYHWASLNLTKRSDLERLELTKIKLAQICLELKFEWMSARKIGNVNGWGFFLWIRSWHDTFMVWLIQWKVHMPVYITESFILMSQEKIYWVYK